LRVPRQGLWQQLQDGVKLTMVVIDHWEIFSYQERKQRNPNGPRGDHLGRRFSLLPGTRGHAQGLEIPNLGRLRGVVYGVKVTTAHNLANRYSTEARERGNLTVMRGLVLYFTLSTVNALRYKNRTTIYHLTTYSITNAGRPRCAAG